VHQLADAMLAFILSVIVTTVANEVLAVASQADEDPQCVLWAASGECIRNPQYMFAECNDACNSQVYVDDEDDCGGWANNGECEKNPGFMFKRLVTEVPFLLQKAASSPHVMGFLAPPQMQCVMHGFFSAQPV